MAIPRREPVALITAGERPASIYYRGGEVQILPHDIWFTKMVQAYRNDFWKYHPDTATDKNVKTGYFFRQARENYKSFMKMEYLWYSVWGLMPPKVSRTERQGRKQFRTETHHDYDSPHSQHHDVYGILKMRYGNIRQAVKEQK